VYVIYTFFQDQDKKNQGYGQLKVKIKLDGSADPEPIPEMTPKRPTRKLQLLPKAHIDAKKKKKKRRTRPKKKKSTPREMFKAQTAVNMTVRSSLEFKVLFVGDYAVGKSTLCQVLNNEINAAELPTAKPTVGQDFYVKKYFVYNKFITVRIVDTAGQERFKAMCQQFYRGAHGAVVMYDITRLDSFDNARNWITDVRAYSGNPLIQILLIGNKSDMANKRQVPSERAKRFAREWHINFVETSSLSHAAAEITFDVVLQDIWSLYSKIGLHALNPQEMHMDRAAYDVSMMPSEALELSFSDDEDNLPAFRGPSLPEAPPSRFWHPRPETTNALVVKNTPEKEEEVQYVKCCAN